MFSIFVQLKEMKLFDKSKGSKRERKDAKLKHKEETVAKKMKVSSEWLNRPLLALHQQLSICGRWNDFVV